MSTPIIGGSRARFEPVRRKIEESQMNALRDILPDYDVLAACRDAGHELRGRLLTPVVTVFHMIAAAEALSEPFVRRRGHRVANVDGFCSSMECNPSLNGAFGASNGRHGVPRIRPREVLPRLPAASCGSRGAAGATS